MAIPATSMRVLLADDHGEFLSLVTQILGAEFAVVGAVTNGHDAVDAAKRLAPDLVVLDITMPGLDGFEVALRIAGEPRP